MTTLSDTTIWAAIALAGLGTQAIRWSFVATLSRTARIPDIVMRILRLIPSAVMAALLAPAIFRPDGDYQAIWANHRLMAAAVAGLVAWRTRNVIATIATGMSVLWLLTWLA